MNRIVTATAALALLAAPAAFASDDRSHGAHQGQHANAHCACMAEHAQGAKAGSTKSEEDVAQRGQLDYPLFTDQG